MSQKSLITETHDAEFVGVDKVLPKQEPEQLPAVIEPPPAVDSMVIRDLRAGFMMMTVPQMQIALAEYDGRRNELRKWLREKLVSGVHFGYPPGTEPKYADAKRADCGQEHAAYVKQWKKGKDGERGEWTFIPLSQWQPKPPLYKAGADFVCDVLGARDEYEADLNAWKQLGEPKGTFVFTCRLFSRITNECLGEGRGCRKVGQKGGDENNSIKMAKKAAKVDAVINAWGLSDLFTQDIDDTPPPAENPTQVPDAPKVQPRGKRVDPTDVGALVTAWKSGKHPDDATQENWLKFVEEHAKRRFNVGKASEWTEIDVINVRRALESGL